MKLALNFGPEFFRLSRQSFKTNLKVFFIYCFEKRPFQSILNTQSLFIVS